MICMHALKTLSITKIVCGCCGTTTLIPTFGRWIVKSTIRCENCGTSIVKNRMRRDRFERN